MMTHAYRSNIYLLYKLRPYYFQRLYNRTDDIKGLHFKTSEVAEAGFFFIGYVNLHFYSMSDSKSNV